MKSLLRPLRVLGATTAPILFAALTAFLAGTSPAQDANVIPFQGQLANQAGQALSPTGAVTLVFRLYTAPVGGMALWEESQPNISVNAGRFSVLLGSRTMLPAAPIFNSTLYLGITVDDGNAQTADVEMRPRQALVPVISARYAQNADKLRGYDWSVLFGTNNPAEGKIEGARIAANSITATQVAPGSIGTDQMATNAVTSAQMAPNSIAAWNLVERSITADKIAAGTLTATEIAVGSIPPDRLFTKTIGMNAPFGGVAVSAVFNKTGSGTPDSPVEAEESRITLVTSGRPVFVFLTQGNPDEKASIRAYYHSWPDSSIAINRNGTRVAWVSMVGQGGVGGVTPSGAIYFVPPGAVSCLDVPPSGTNTYSVSVGANGAGGVINVRLVAFEL